MKQKILLNLILLATLTGCGSGSSDNDDDTVAPINVPAYSPVGQYVDIPEFDGVNDYFDDENMRVNNSGVYFLVSKDPGPDWVYRYRISDASPEWYIQKHTKSLNGFRVAQQTNEQPSGFSVLAWDDTNYGYFNANNGLPSSFNSPVKSTSFATKMVVDRSPLAMTWSFEGQAVYVKQNNSSNNWDPVPGVPQGGFLVVEPDDDGVQTAIWGSNERKLYKISPSGCQLVADLPAGNGIYDVIAKIRVVNDDVWVGTHTKIYRFVNGSQPSLVYTYPSTTVSFQGNFAVDNKYLYTNDGKKIDYSLNIVSDLFPPAPNDPNKMQELMDYIEMTGAFRSGSNLEVSTDPLDKYIYLYSGMKKKLLKIKK